MMLRQIDGEWWPSRKYLWLYNHSSIAFEEYCWKVDVRNTVKPRPPWVAPYLRYMRAPRAVGRTCSCRRLGKAFAGKHSLIVASR